jgi:uncharacterized membrane protein
VADPLIPIRWIHVLSGSIWLGEVAVINFILIPVLGKLDVEHRRQFLTTVFPRVFRMASVLSATSVVSGLMLITMITDGNFAQLLEGRWGHAILFGGTLGTLLTVFHFFMENRLAKKIGVGCEHLPSDAQLTDVHAKLKVVPRAGMLVISTIFLSMMYAVRGL